MPHPMDPRDPRPPARRPGPLAAAATRRVALALAVSAGLWLAVAAALDWIG
ncbi:hypothetical protein [Azospirillum halopraeferens]|uniref:hypothetical protein n=1 Tax=Azospirillum halopraeferens TaxID=34010 RepID=UPI00040806E8|nr:hypothetical protein [Azospirillum halopraeferens]